MITPTLEEVWAFIQSLVQGNRQAPGLARTHDHKPVDTSAFITQADIANFLAQKKAYKSADETINNVDVLQDDDHLNLAVGASEVWAFRLVLFYTSATTTPDFKYKFTAPAGATGFHGVIVWSSGIGPNKAYSTTITGTLSASMDTSTIVLIDGTIINGANAGTLQLQWAQNIKTVENTTLLKGSYLIATKLA